MEDVHDNSLDDSENENVAQNMNITEEEGLGDEGSIVPKVDMHFKDENQCLSSTKDMHTI